MVIKPTMRYIPNEVKALGSLIHEAIHDTSKSHVDIDGILYPITRYRNGSRCVRVGAYLFMEQNKRKETPYAKRARNGERLTWIVPSIPDMEWHLIEDEPIDQVMRAGNGTRVPES